MLFLKVKLAHSDPSGSRKLSSPFLFSQSELCRAFLFLFVQSWRPLALFVWRIQSNSSFQPASCVCLSLQNTTDSSSNSSQKLESSLQPLDSSPLPQRHKCVLEHRHDPHDPYRFSDHYLLDQVRQRTSGCISMELELLKKVPKVLMNL